jgi:hypothetical protein
MTNGDQSRGQCYFLLAMLGGPTAFARNGGQTGTMVSMARPTSDRTR